MTALPRSLLGSLLRHLALTAAALPLLTAHAEGAAAAPAKTTLRYVYKVEDMPGSADTPAKSAFQTGLGTAMARQMQRPVSLSPLPRKRMMGALESGEADMVCGYLPAWFKGDVNWSRPFIPISEVLVASKRVPAPTSIEDVRGKTVGTVLGFSYPEIEKRLGADFIRDDAPSLELSLRKWQRGRFDYFLATGVSLDRQFDAGELAAGYSQLILNEEKTGCAISRAGNVSVAEVKAAIDALERSGEATRLMRLR